LLASIAQPLQTIYMKHTQFFTAVLFCLFSLQANAQTKPVAKFKPPKLTTMLGEFKDSTGITKETAAQIIGLPLKIYDAAKKTYSVANYQLAYKKTGIREDEITGKLIPTSTLSYQLFTETPVSPIWIKTIRAQIKSGYELYFFEVVAKDEKGRVMYSSNLKLTIK